MNWNHLFRGGILLPQFFLFSTLFATARSLTLTATTSDLGGYNISCNGADDGVIDLSVSNGTVPYTYNWDNDSSTEDLSVLTAGVYTVIVVDSIGLTDTLSITLTQPSALSISLFSTAYNGYLNAYVNGGVPPYTYQWQGPNVNTVDAIWSYLDVYSEGDHSVQVIDANNDTGNATFSMVFADFNISLSSPEVSPGSNASCLLQPKA